MRILYVVHEYWPRYQAGTENYTHYLAESMADLGHEVFVVAAEPLSNKNYEVEEYNEGRVRVIKIHKNVGVVGSIKGSYHDEKYQKVFQDVINKIDPDIVHVQHFLYASHGIVEIIRRRNIPILCTLHDSWLECFRVTRSGLKNELCGGWSPEKCSECLKLSELYTEKNQTPYLVRIAQDKLGGRRFFNRIINISKKVAALRGNKDKENIKAIAGRYRAMKKLVKSVDLFISPSNFLRDSYIKWGIREEKILYSRNGTMVTPERPGQPKSKKPGEATVFAFTSFIRPEKGVEILLKAFEILEKEKNINARLIVYGGYEKGAAYGSEFLENIKKIKNAEYRGKFDNKDISDILAEVDYLVLPSLWFENAPLVIEEAYLNKIPCIVSNIGGMAERVRNGVDGFHFTVGDPLDLAGKIKLVALNKSIRDELVKNIPQVKTMGENAVELEGIYFSLIAKRSRKDHFGKIRFRERFGQ